MSAQESLFDMPEDWEGEWEGMPEFKNENKFNPEKTLIIHFQDKESRLKFSELIGQNITPRTQSIWYPKAEIETYADKRY